MTNGLTSGAGIIEGGACAGSLKSESAGKFRIPELVEGLLSSLLALVWLKERQPFDKLRDTVLLPISSALP
jgi:hypothetical protein